MIRQLFRVLLKICIDKNDTDQVPADQADIETIYKDIQEGSFIIALNEQMPYVGKVVDIDENEFE